MKRKIADLENFKAVKPSNMNNFRNLKLFNLLFQIASPQTKHRGWTPLEPETSAFHSYRQPPPLLRLKMTQTVAGRDDGQPGEEDWKKKCHPESKFKAVEKQV